MKDEKKDLAQRHPGVYAYVCIIEMHCACVHVCPCMCQHARNIGVQVYMHVCEWINVFHVSAHINTLSYNNWVPVTSVLR